MINENSSESIQHFDSNVIELVSQAWRIGSVYPLQGIHRGPGAATPDYYHFLYGLCRVCTARRVLEIGTDYGGSILAMREAVSDHPHTLVTVDITNVSDAQLAGISDVIKVRGDGAAHSTISNVITHLKAPIDLLYVDAKHDFRTTMSVYGIFVAMLAPRVLVFDDITLNEEMQLFWKLMIARYGNRAVNAAEIIPDVRKHVLNPGIGVVLT